MELTAERLHEVMTYDPNTGVLQWRVSRKGVRPGKAGAVNGSGYRNITIDGRQYHAHRLAWLYVHGRWPSRIDHANGMPDDNRLINLREASVSENKQNTRRMSNNKSGFKGVHWRAKRRKWRATIKVAGRIIELGCFATAEEAHAAYCAAAVKHYGEFARFR